MQPRPACGEESYQSHGRLAGTKTLITGADSGIGRAVAIACTADQQIPDDTRVVLEELITETGR